MPNTQANTARNTATNAAGSLLPVSVIVPVRNEAENLPRCLASLARCREVYVVDSQSSDDTVDIARSFGVTVVQFYYRGGWPKKRQWALDNLPLESPWVLLLDADEVLTPELAEEIETATHSAEFTGYWVPLRISFLGRTLRHGDTSFRKLSLFRRGTGRFECRLEHQDSSMADMEIHEHVIVDGPTGELNNALLHHNVNSLSRYIEKHNQYSNWEAQVLFAEETGKTVPTGPSIQPNFWGMQAQRRRWLRKKFFHLPGSPVLFFFYKYLFRLGFWDGAPGLIYCGFQATQFFHIKAKLYELRSRSG
jgi:glycosyltransferase involved in cell wall biosynthesis